MLFYPRYSLLINKTGVRCLCAKIVEPATREKKSATGDSIEWSKAKPFKSIPGPTTLPFIGTLWTSLPVIGRYYGLDPLSVLRKQREEYGDIFKISGLNMPTMVVLFKPEDFETLYRNEGQWPKRNVLPVLNYYQEKYAGKWYPTEYAGIFTADGPLWQEGRSKLNPILMQTKTAKSYVEPMNKVASKFINRVRLLESQNPKGEMPENFIYELHKWSLESVMLLAVSIDCGLLDPNSEENKEAQEFIQTVLETFHLLFKLDIKPSFWRHITTPTFKKFVEVMDKSNTFAATQIERGIAKAKLDGNPDEPTIIKRLMKMDEKFLAPTVKDMLQAGVDTTSRTMGAVLYHVASNPEVQERLRKEVRQVLPDLDTPVTSQTLEQMPYLRAVIKETLRLVPIGVGGVRQIQKDMVFSGYQVPKYTNVVTGNMFLCYDEKYFSQPKKFMPERWLRTEGAREQNINPWVYQPFGFGPRSCIGKRLANLELEVLLAKMVRNFKMEWHHPPMRYSAELIHGVADPLKFQMKSLN